MDRRRFMTTTMGLFLASSFPSFAFSNQSISFKSLAAQKNIGFGTAVGKEIYRNAQYSRLVKQHCSSLTPENAFKWHELVLFKNNYSFDDSDRLYDFCVKNDYSLRGHALIFEKSMRKWLAQCGCNLQTDLQRFIATVTARYPLVTSWDLFNEIVDHDGYNGWLRKDTLFEKLGSSYISDLSTFTSQINPNYELVVNEWVGPYKNRYFRKRRYAMLKMLEALKDMEVPINVFGIQSHLNFAKKDYDRKDWQAFCKECKDLGFDIKITEIDLSMHAQGPITHNKQEVIKATNEYLEDTLALGNVKDIICWGLADPYAFAMRRPEWSELDYGATPFNGIFEMNLLGQALITALQNAPAFVSVQSEGQTK